MMGRIYYFKRWLATRDTELWILAAITLAGLVVRWIFAIGAALPDDGGYATFLKGVAEGQYPSVGRVGQVEFRPGLLLPIGATLRLFGWTAHGLVAYPVITGGFIPILTGLWLRRHLRPGSLGPLLCTVILAFYPVLFVDSLMLVNEMPMIFWCLLSVNFFGSAYARVVELPSGARRPGSWIGFSLLAGAAFAAAHQVKILAIPMLGIWLLTEFFLQVARRGWPLQKDWTALALASLVFLLPTLGVQSFYLAKTGHFFGNISAELRLYDARLPDNYLSGHVRLHDVLIKYFEQLFIPIGPPGFRVLLHGAWIWVALGLGAVAGILWRWLPSPERALAFIFLGSALALFLFIEYWPFRIFPYYLPILFDGRPWRYADILAPPFAASVTIVLTLPRVFHRWILNALRCGLLGACFGICGYCLVVRYYIFEDCTSDYRRAAVACATSLKSYWQLGQIMDYDGCGQFGEALGWPDKTTFQPSRTQFLDLRDSPPVCIWTGGARREGMNADLAWQPDRLQYLGGDVVLIHTFDGLRRPWRSGLLQLWLFRPKSTDSHEPQRQP